VSGRSWALSSSPVVGGCRRLTAGRLAADRIRPCLKPQPVATTIGLCSRAGAVYGVGTTVWPTGRRPPGGRQVSRPGGGCDVGRDRAPRAAGQPLRGAPHRQTYTSADEARAHGIDADEVLKPLAMRTGSGYALMVIPASRRLDLPLARAALADNHARLAPRTSSAATSPANSSGRCRRWGRSRCGPGSCSAAGGPRPPRSGRDRGGPATTRSRRRRGR
jgi:Aminoacyl-tRNA editing domain